MKIRYYAWMRDAVGLEEEEVELPPEIQDVRMLTRWLAGLSDRHSKAFEFVETVKIVVNRLNAYEKTPVRDTDEVIFMPPIAGG